MHSPLNSADNLHDAHAQQQQVVDLASREGVFSSGVIAETVEYVFNKLGLHPKYFQHFGAHQIAKHVNLLLAATKVAQATKSRSIEFHIEEQSSAFFVCTIDAETPAVTERLVSDFLEKRREPGVSFSVVYMSSSAPAMPGFDAKLALYMVDLVPFEGGDVAKMADEDDLMTVATRRFILSKAPAALDMYQNLITRVMETRSTVCDVSKVDEGSATLGYAVKFAVYETSHRNYVKELAQIFRSVSLLPKRYYIESFANGVVTYTCYFDSGTEAEVRRLAETLSFVPHFKQTPGRSKLVWDLVIAESISPEHCIYLLALVKFCFSFFPKESSEYLELAEALKNDSEKLLKLEELHRQAVNERLTTEKIYTTLIQHLELTRVAFADFEAIAQGKVKPFRNTSLEAKINEAAETSLDRKILKSLLTFNENLLMTNFYKKDSAPSAIAFRFKPDILQGRPKLLYPETPFGIYMIMGRGFYGFHVRFRDVARGGVRLIRSGDRTQYERNAQSVFDETYNLAYTQQQKNKDIPEGGSKGTILLDSDWATPMSQTQGRNSVFKYFDALLDCMLADKVGIYSHLDHPEILFFGPDEGTAEFMDMGAVRGRERGYKYWKALTTGKSTTYGGVPHDVYGMTTMGIHAYVTGLLDKVGLDESNITKFQTGGPDGDLGSNEILISKDRTLGIADGSGVAYDPAGLDRAELTRLAHERVPIINFNRAKLSNPKTAFVVGVDDKDVTLPDGSLWRSGAELRDKFHLTDYAAADLFVPCGGRPQAVNGKNVNKLFKDGKPKFRFIVEGANLFFTDDARRVLEAAGVHLFRDASANKGGVTSSSLEVFAALAMEPSLHDKLLTVQSGLKEPPQFYVDSVNSIQEFIKTNAKLEFEAIWDVNKNNGMTKLEATKVLSQKINNLADYIGEVFDMKSDLAMKVLKLAIPSLLQEKCGFENILNRCPQNYLRAVAAVWIASRYVYRYGINASEFNFYKFMRGIELGEEHL